MVVVSRTLRSAARTRSQTKARIRAAGRFSRADPALSGVRAVDHGQHLAERDLGRGASQAISSRRTAGADDQPRSFQLEQNLHQVTLGNRRESPRSRGSAQVVRRDPAGPAPARPDRHIPPSPRSSSGHLPPWPLGQATQSWLLSSECSPHSVLACPAHRPARSSCPSTTGLVQGQQPIEGYP